MTGRSAEMIETLFRWRVDFCYVQDYRWNGCGARVLAMGNAR